MPPVLKPRGKSTSTKVRLCRLEVKVSKILDNLNRTLHKDDIECNFLKATGGVAVVIEGSRLENSKKLIYDYYR